MKKFISILLILTMLTVPTAFADTDTSSDLENVLVTVKSKISVPSELSEFGSNVSSYSGKIQYNFEWYSPDYEKSLSVSADSNGRIISYHNYSEKMSEKKLSGISKSEIISYANSFIEKALPEIYQNLVFDSDSYSVNGASRYSLNYERQMNNVPIKDNYVNITVCISENDTLFIRNMSANIDYETPFAESTGELADYVQKYKEAFPLELVYENEYTSDWKTTGEFKATPTLIYRSKDNEAGFISASTGEIVIEDKYNEMFRNEASEDSSASGGASMEKGEQLTEKELAEITQVQGLLSISQVENKVKSLPYIKLPTGIKLKNSSLHKNDRGDYIYNLYYSSEKEEMYAYASMSVNAKDGKLISYNCSSDYRDVTLTESQKKSAGNKIEQFLLSTAKDEYTSTVLSDFIERNNLVAAHYQRMVNGIKHLDNGINVTFDTSSSVVTHFSLSFTDGNFEDPAKAIDIDVAYNNLLEYSPVVKMYVKTGGVYTKCFTLEKIGVTLDAITGEIKNAYDENSSEFSYTDIKGHWVEDAATKLCEIQIGFKGEKLNPKASVTQEEYLRLLATGIYGKYYHNYTQDELYAALIREKIISEEEKNPTSTVAREDAFVYLIRMAKLEKIAKLENIYKISYADSNQLSDGTIGYCAILSGLGVICGDGGYLRPKDNLTHAEAIMMLYRYLLTM